MGTEAEHAVLLTNYLTGLGRTTYLVLGRGVPEGKTAYCLTIEVGCFFQHSPEYSSSETGEWRTVALERSHWRTLFLTGDFPPTQVWEQNMKTLSLFYSVSSIPILFFRHTLSDP